MWGFEMAVMACMIVANAVLAAYEFALASVSLARLDHLVREGRRGAGDALEMKRRIEGSLAVVQLGITLVGAVAAAVGGAGAVERLAPWLHAEIGVSVAVGQALALALVVAPLTAVTIVAGELLPKVFALRNAERVLLVLSPPMRAMGGLLRPAVWVLETAVNGILRLSGGSRTQAGDAQQGGELQDLRASAALARAARLIGSHEEKIILAALQLRSRPLREVMLPIAGVHTLPAQATAVQALEAVRTHMHTRYPLAAGPGDLRAFPGYVSLKDLLLAAAGPQADRVTLGELARPLPAFPAGMSLARTLEAMLRGRTHIALVEGDRGATVGLVTLEDLLEELVGDIEDEFAPQTNRETGDKSKK